MKIGVAQLTISNTLEHNVQKIINFLGRAAVDGIEFVCFPEMCLTGYNSSILFNADLGSLVEGALARIHAECRDLGVGVAVGHGYPGPDGLRNRATVLFPGEPRFQYDKIHLVDEEKKYFRPGDTPLTFALGELKAGLIICRDQNYPELAAGLKEKGASVLFILSAHYHRPKQARLKVEKNRAMPIARAVENGMTVFLSNTIGSHIEMVSLGNSLVVDPDGTVIVSAGEADETLLSVSL